jgi:diacylglycerol kinase family enzyme
MPAFSDKLSTMCLAYSYQVSFAVIIYVEQRSSNWGLREPQELMIDGEIFPGIVSVHIQILPMALECIHKSIAI